MYSSVAPTDMANTTSIVPIHLPKINPPNKIMGLAKPKRKTQITVKKMNNRLRIK